MLLILIVVYLRKYVADSYLKLDKGKIDLFSKTFVKVCL